MGENETEKSVSVATDETPSETATDTVADLSTEETFSPANVDAVDSCEPSDEDAAADNPVAENSTEEEQVVGESAEKPIVDDSVDDSAEELSEEELLERALSDVMPAEEEYKLPDGISASNDDDSEEGALAVGISGIYDEYGREILAPVFENYLRQSVNAVKLAYSKLKNTALSYKGVKRKYDGDKEKFSFGGKVVFAFSVGENELEVICAGENPPKEGVFFRPSALGGKTAYILPVKKGMGEDSVNLRNAIEIIETLLVSVGAEKKAYYAPTAYAARYDFNFEAVVKGKENIAPDALDFSSEEYDPIEGELTRDIIEELLGENHDLDKKKGKEKLEGLRQQATDIKSAVAMTEPIVYFFENALNRQNESEFLQIKQVLNDKFLGKMLPQQFAAIAENSERAETLNYFALKEAVTYCNENPKSLFCLSVSCRLLRKKTALDKLIKSVSAVENNNLAIALDAIMLEALGKTGTDGINRLREQNVKIVIDGAESVGLHMLTDYAFDYLRFDGRYFENGNTRALSLLDMMVGYAKAQGITTIMNYVNTNKDVKLYLAHDIDVIEGAAVGVPKRSATGAINEARKLPV